MDDDYEEMMYQQAFVALMGYRRDFEIDHFWAVQLLGIGAGWMAGKEPDPNAKGGWLWAAMQDAIKKEGGAIYHVNDDGFVTELFLEGERILRRTPDDQEGILKMIIAKLAKKDGENLA